MVKRLSVYVIRYWPIHAAVLLLSLAAAGISLLQPWLFKLLVDDVLIGGQGRLLAVVLVGYAATHVGALAVAIARHYCSVYAGNKGVVDLRNDLVAHLRRLSLRYFYREETGRIMSVMTNDAPAMEQLLQSLIPAVLVDLSYLFAMGYIIIRSEHAPLIATALLMIPFYIFFPAAIARTFRRAFREVQESQADVSAGLQESIASTREILAFNREKWDQERLDQLFTQTLRQRLRAILLEARYGGIQNLASFVSPVLILAVGAPYVLRGEITIGYLLAFQTWTHFLYTHSRNLYNTFQSVQQSLGAAERVFEFLGEPVDPVRMTGTSRLNEVKGEIRFENVTFSYDGVRNVLHGVDLVIEPGMTVAIVGPSGSGKSTVFYLLQRFFDPDGGRILLDGTDYRDLDVEWLRQQIGVVFQEPFLFSGTLYENIAFGREGATPGEVLRAAELAQVAEFAEKLPERYETRIGERGVRLSGGQKQRIAIARALLRDPKILLLDEATSALDSESEAKVQEAMAAVMKRRTCIVIAHRLSTVRNADCIAFLRDGRISEIGSHEELALRNGDYARFCRLQFQAGA